MSLIDTFAAPGRFWRGNIHGHSTRSDGAWSPEDVCAAYAREGYDFIALTDHFLARFDFPITNTTALRTDDFTTILGAEVHAPETARGMEWHILAVGLPADFARTGEAETGPELARRCLNAGAFVTIAHPHWYNLTVEDARTLGDVHAVEVYNHTCAIH
ncbi:MAG: PHP domain-containing protein, partial [Pseudomonadota bacterium]